MGVQGGSHELPSWTRDIFTFTQVETHINVMIKFMPAWLVVKHTPVVKLLVKWHSSCVLQHFHPPPACKRTSSEAEPEAVVGLEAVCEQ